uniref:Uncharacterized protein n=1 Tax=Panagrolaimus sp. PS1159 TaxID=55785 RepID=A0AC35FHB1_9BILA
MPPPFVECFKYANSLGLNVIPDYVKVQKCLHDCLPDNYNINEPFDWELTETAAPSPTLSSTSKIPARKNEDSDDDELSIFGVFVGRSLRKLASSSPALAIQVKKQINDLLCEAELNELGYKKSPTT